MNVSRFSKRKDHYTTLKAFKIVLRRIKNVKLILIGYGPELKNIIGFAKNLKINPNVLVESLTIGTPVISTNANAGASEILLNGKGGDLIRIGDYKNLAKKIIRHFSYPKILIKKAKIAKKNLYRFETKRHSKIYTNLFQRI